jgi:hypothetical protein
MSSNIAGAITQGQEHRRRPVPLSAIREKGLHYSSAIISEYAGRYLDLMVEARVGKNFETRADGATFGVIGAVDESPNACLDHRPSAHAAGLDRDV